jgi:AbrB family looped-hinge helix DNA binding protein
MVDLPIVGREPTIVRVSSKGQIVIPVAVRRRLGLKTGQPLAIRATTQDEIVLRPADRDADAVDEMLRRLRAAARKLGGDPLRELQERRRRERAREARKYERWSH